MFGLQEQQLKSPASPSFAAGCQEQGAGCFVRPQVYARRQQTGTMKPEQHALEEEFYRECARLLDVVHTYRPWIGRGPNRWNNRHPGNGRFPGFGTIRLYSPSHIHVSLRQPVILNRVCRSVEEVYDLLGKLKLKAMRQEKSPAQNRA
jgi:hypothetical protein